MSFYRRYHGLQPGVLPVPAGTGPIKGEVPVGSIERARVPVFPPVPLETQSFKPTNVPKTPIPAFLTTSKQTKVSFSPPGSIAMVPAVADSPKVRKAAASNDKAVEAAQIAKEAAVMASVAVIEASKAVAQASTPELAFVAEQAVAQAAVAERTAQKTADKAEKTATKAQSDAQAAAEDYTRNYDDPTARNYVDPKVPLVAWDQVDISEAIPVALPDGTTTMAMKPKVSLLTVVGGAGTGFLVGGPVGAAIGAAAGYFLSRR